MYLSPVSEHFDVTEDVSITSTMIYLTLPFLRPLLRPYKRCVFVERLLVKVRPACLDKTDFINKNESTHIDTHS